MLENVISMILSFHTGGWKRESRVSLFNVNELWEVHQPTLSEVPSNSYVVGRCMGVNLK